jgi:hypothetical protein
MYTICERNKNTTICVQSQEMIQATKEMITALKSVLE